MKNLCEDFKATGRDFHGGYVEYIKVSEDFAYMIPSGFSDPEAAPLLCGGAIGYRSLQLGKLENGHRLGFTGFGASAHIALQSYLFLTHNELFPMIPTQQRSYLPKIKHWGAR